MKTAVFAFFGLVATGFSAKFNLGFKDLMASGSGSTSAGAIATKDMGAASGAVDGDGMVLGAAAPGGALAMGMASPSL